MTQKMITESETTQTTKAGQCCFWSEASWTLGGQQVVNWPTKPDHTTKCWNVRTIWKSVGTENEMDTYNTNITIYI